MSCSACQHGTWEKFQIRCEITGELMEPLEKCPKWLDEETKTRMD